MSTHRADPPTVEPETIDPVADAAIYVRLSREHDQWYAEATDYRVVGVGGSRQDALRSMLRMLEAYLRFEHSHGRDAREARRRPGRFAVVGVRALALLSRPFPREHRRALRIRLSH